MFLGAGELSLQRGQLGRAGWPARVKGVTLPPPAEVSIASDMFMNSIEEITSRSKQVTKKDGRVITYKVWNPTVANLTLLALGSSAPEILLSVVETLNKERPTNGSEMRCDWMVVSDGHMVGIWLVNGW
eukprot:Skav235771  [mRNA]  locus=scaffold1666:71883:76279:+ [translate_table: standard]